MHQIFSARRCFLHSETAARTGDVTKCGFLKHEPWSGATVVTWCQKLKSVNYSGLLNKSFFVLSPQSGKKRIHSCSLSYFLKKALNVFINLISFHTKTE